MPDPSSGRDFTEAAIDAIARYVGLTEGRAFVLFTSYAVKPWMPASGEST